MPNWTIADMPSQVGRVALVTGGNSGLGYESVRALVRAGAKAVIAVRDQAKGEAVRAELLRKFPGASIEILPLDLSSLASIRAFATDFTGRYEHLDILINNAGVMAIPQSETADGFEMQFGVNHLGHFALTGLLLAPLLATPGSRIVTTTSGAHTYGHIHFDDLTMHNNYTRYNAYGHSKFANVLFTFELQRRLEAAGASTLSLSAHPGYARTGLQHKSATESVFERVGYGAANIFLAQSAAKGALPQLYAATAPGVQGGEFYGPHMMMRGYPKLSRATESAYDEATARRLWQVSEDLTGVTYNFSVPAQQSNPQTTA